MTATNETPNEIVEAELLSEQTLEAVVASLAEEVVVMRTTLNHQVTLLAEIKDAINPMLEKLSNNPMFRMMFPDKD